MSGNDTALSEQTQSLERSVDEHDHVRGPEDAAVTLVQYGDFDCPDCAEVYPEIEAVRDRLGDRLRYVYRHFPLTEIHPRAKHAAEAAEAAGSQGKFWEMHDRLYEHPEELSDSELVDHAAALDLDTDRFTAALNESRYEERVREDFESGIDSGVDRAPTFFIDGERYDGRYTADALSTALAEAGDLTDVSTTGGSTSSDALRETIDRSEHGAPAAGSAVRDRFSADEIFQRVVATADEEFSRSNRLLFLSGLAAGIVMSFSFLGSAALTALVSGQQVSGSATALGYLLYPLGFVGVVLGSYQLFTENTLTPVTLVMTRIASIPALFRVWGIVLVANVLGAAASAYVLANTGVFSPEAAAIAHEFGAHFLELPWGDVFWKGVFAGALVGGMVWLVHAARDTAARVLVIFLLTYMVAAAGLAHSIVGAAEVLYVVFSGDATLVSFLGHFLAPAVLGNTVGGVVLVALLNYSQTRDRRIPDRDCRVLELEWSEWLFGNHIGRQISPTFDPESGEGTDAVDAD